MPEVTHGVQIGDVQTGRALVWARASEPSRLIVEWDTTERFANPRRIAGPVVTPDGDHAATLAIDGLARDGQTIAVRARFEREAARGASTWATARFQMPRSDRFASRGPAIRVAKASVATRSGAGCAATRRSARPSPRCSCTRAI